MIKIESATLEEAYINAASTLECSVTELHVEVVQFPSKGVLGLFKKSAIIVAAKKHPSESAAPKKEAPPKQSSQESVATYEPAQTTPANTKKSDNTPAPKEKPVSHTLFQDTIMPQSFVSMQEEDEDTYYEPVYADEGEEEGAHASHLEIEEVAKEVKADVNALFKTICFDIDEVEVSVYDEHTLLMEFKGEDAALLIGKEGYRYKALSYMLFNWINTKYQVGLRLEIAEFLKNQEEAVSKYLEGVAEIVAKEGRAQTKILDGVLVQIALKELRDMYPEKYVAIRSTRDGLKYIIVNDYHAK